MSTRAIGEITTVQNNFNHYPAHKRTQNTSQLLSCRQADDYSMHVGAAEMSELGPPESSQHKLRKCLEDINLD